MARSNPVTENKTGGTAQLGIFVINLDRSADRWADSWKRLAAAALADAASSWPSALRNCAIA